MLRFIKAKELQRGDWVECSQNHLRKEPLYTEVISGPRYDDKKVRFRIRTAKGLEVNRGFAAEKTVAVLC